MILDEKFMKCQEDGHNKIYCAQLINTGTDFKISYQFGRIDKKLRFGVYENFASRWEAEREFSKLTRSKFTKGYRHFEPDDAFRHRLEFTVNLTY